MKNYVETIMPNVSDTWRTDKIYIKVKGDMKYLFAMMNDETRFWIAQEVAEAKYTHDARKLFQIARAPNQTETSQNRFAQPLFPDSTVYY